MFEPDGSQPVILRKLDAYRHKRVVGEAGRFLVATAISATVTLLFPVFLHQGLGVEERLSVGLALATAFVVNFFVLRNYVFRSASSKLPQLIKFAVNSAAFRGAEYVAFLVLFDIYAFNYVLTLFFVLLVSFCAKFIVTRLFVFS